jgi:hypothetical protein
MTFDRLDFISAKRAGGGGKTERSFLDYLINGRRLSEIVKLGDQIGLFGWLGDNLEQHFVNQLLLKEKSDLSSGRMPIYICPECADLGCGCISIRIKKDSDAFIWTEFAFENNYENEFLETYSDVPDFRFNKSEYYAALMKISQNGQNIHKV